MLAMPYLPICYKVVKIQTGKTLILLETLVLSSQLIQ